MSTRRRIQSSSRRLLIQAKTLRQLKETKVSFQLRRMEVLILFSRVGKWKRGTRASCKLLVKMVILNVDISVRCPAASNTALNSQIAKGAPATSWRRPTLRCTCAKISIRCRWRRRKRRLAGEMHLTTIQNSMTNLSCQARMAHSTSKLSM